MTDEYVLLVTADGSEIAGASRSEIVDQIVDGHRDAPDTDRGAATRLELREGVLAQAASQAQAIVMASVADAHGGSVPLDEDALTVIYHDRSTQTPEFESWDSDIPLFLMASGYQPYTGMPRPSGDTVVFLDSLNESTFLEGLQSAGFAELYVRESGSMPTG